MGNEDEPDLHEVDVASLHAAPETIPTPPPPSSPAVEDEVSGSDDSVYEDTEGMTADELAEETEEERQRRENVRINIRCPVTVKIDGHESMRSRARDMSATGIGFSTRLPLEIGMSGRVTIHFDRWAFSKEFVVRFSRSIIAGKHVGVEFRELTQDEHERIVKEVFAIQREALRVERLSAKTIS